MKWFYAAFGVGILFLLVHLNTSASLPRQTGSGLITAHRGSSAVAPENTLEAIQQAIQDGAGAVEIDVRLTADGVAVLSHDDSLKRTAGVEVLISESEYAQLKSYNVAHKFSHRYGHVTIPTLAEALQTAKGNLKVNIELKNDPPQPGLAEEVVRIVAMMGMEDDCVITSFDRNILKKVRGLTGHIRTGLIVGKSQHLTEDLYTDPSIQILSLKDTLVSRNVMKQARDHGMEVYAWTVNHRPLMKEMMRYEVDSIITDNPSLLYRMLNQTP